mgnify:CR=1 FL=1
MGMGMSFGISAETGNNIQTDGLIFYVDAAYKKSYSGSGNTVVDLVNSNTGTSSSSPTFNAGGYWEFDSSTSDDFIFSTNPLHSNSVTSFTVSTWNSAETSLLRQYAIAAIDNTRLAAYSCPLLLADAWMELGSEVVPVPSTRQPHAAPSFQLPSESDVGVGRVFEAHA